MGSLWRNLCLARCGGFHARPTYQEVAEEYFLKPRHKRMAAIALGVVALGAAAALVLAAFQKNLVFFFTPSQVAANEAPQGRSFRIGGMVVPGSLKREGVNVEFTVTDTAKSMRVTYRGQLPDLFREGKGVVALARPAAQAQALLVAFAFGCLTYAFVANDFSVAYVAMHSNTALPLHYRIAGVWGGHEGSLLLWALMLGVWMTAVSLFSTQLPEEIVARVLGVMGLVSAGFLAFLLFTSNPFDRLLPPAADGRDLNPLLQDPGMVLHPPMLYMGYVGFSVAFAFAVAALLSGKFDATWARWSRPWTTVAWAFLTVGIALGSGWAYYELGWGGWWFWDPVENASFMPWLVGTALIHSLAVTEKRGSFRSWTVLLAIVAFGLSLLGTFLVRSGVLTSVHAFAVDPKRGVFILGLFALMIGGALVLYAWRTSRIGLGGDFAPVSRESLLLANNVLLASAAGAVFLGTLYPLLIDALGVGKLSV